MPSTLDFLFAHQDGVLADLGIQNQQMMRVLTLAEWHLRSALTDERIPADTRTEMEIALAQLGEARRLEGKDISVVTFAWSLWGLVRRMLRGTSR